MLRIDQIKIRVSDKQPDLRKAVCLRLKISDSDITDIGIIRRSLDARKKPELYYVFSLCVSCRNEDKLLRRFSKDSGISSYVKTEYRLPGQGCEKLTDRPLIVGMGPAGLFCAYELAR
ncbi:MAG: FAD-dependent oxidoreductase, partial [Lachnospiraceae bacterium]|nr:FAD-dependent oxidoreductase [Lachnospiraceae bacterium]